MPEKTNSIFASPSSTTRNGMQNPATLASTSRIVTIAVQADLRRPAALQLDMPQAELCDRLRRGVERAGGRSADSMEALRAAVCEFTAALKEKGTTPEGVLISLKALIADQTFALIPTQPFGSSGNQLREQISTWSIQAFFMEKNG